jgi:predicted nuclease of restriction endonuclease-like (RecB) superfamily
MDFQTLVDIIRATHEHFAAQAVRAVNVGLTLRNWAIGHHIVEYEQRGLDRAAYGEFLLEKLSERLQAVGMERVEARELRRFRQFRLTYPQIREALTPDSGGSLPAGFDRTLDLAAEGSSAIRESVTPEFVLPGKKIVTSLSFTHLSLLLQVDDPLKRAFYELECIRGGWSVRELRRQMSSLLFERTGLSTDKDRLAARTREAAEIDHPALAVRDPYVFEFLGLKPRDVMGESVLEDALLDKVQEFLLELGRGFCFEARQKRLRIGDELFFVDLVFYHRILKCHVLVELKVDEFRHEHLGQLNTYVNWFRRHEMAESDNPPVGLLLCTRKNHALLEYALAGMDNQLFVSRYQLQLPKKEELERFLEAELKEHGFGEGEA